MPTTEKSNQVNKPHKLNENTPGKRSVGNLHATFDEAEAGNNNRMSTIRDINAICSLLEAFEVLRQHPTLLTRHDLLKVDNLPQGLNDANLKKAITVLDVMNFSAEEREAYEEHLKWLRVEANTVKKAEARGKIENAKEIAKAMIKKKMEVKLISELTKLSIEEINNL